jgi:hypothetical protein
MRRSSIISILVCLCVLPATAWADTKVYKWVDYTKPFGTRVKVLSDKPSIVQVDLPESIIGHDKIVLNISTHHQDIDRVSTFVLTIESRIY